MLFACAIFTLTPRGVRSLHSACLSVCLSAHIPQRLHIQTSGYFLYMLSVAVARSSSDDNAICYVLPVLWMTSCFHMMGQIPIQAWSLVICVELLTMTLQVVLPSCAPGQSLLSLIALLLFEACFVIEWRTWFQAILACLMSAERPLSKLEMLAKMRDMKRRRQSYRGKSTHTANKNYTEVFHYSVLLIITLLLFILFTGFL